MRYLRLLGLLGLLLALDGCGGQTSATTVSQLSQPSATAASPPVQPTVPLTLSMPTLPPLPTIVASSAVRPTTLPSTQVLATRGPDSAPRSTATPRTATAGSSTPAGMAEAQFALIDYFGGIGERGIFYCDPDAFPVAQHDREQEQALELFPAIQADAAQFQAIAQRLGLAQAGSFSDQQKLAIYREYKHLARVVLEPDHELYRFRLPIRQFNGAANVIVSGTISADGVIAVLTQEDSGVLECPICLAENTRIATPSGTVAVQALREGMLVWTRDSRGTRVAAPLLATSRTPVPATHRVIHLRLNDGRELFASPNHPTADGRRLGSLKVGDALDGATVTSAGLTAYTASATYDLLPAGDTGFYWADGVLLASTLR